METKTLAQVYAALCQMQKETAANYDALSLKVKHMANDLTSQINSLDDQINKNRTDAATVFAQLKQNILDLQQQLTNMSGITPEAQAAITKALSDAVAEHDDIVAAGGHVGDPGALVPLAASYADRTSFNEAVSNYQGPEAVTLDLGDGSAASAVKGGTDPALAYFVQADGSISTTPQATPAAS